MGIHVLILAEMELGGMGGGESVIYGLVRGLSEIDRGDDRFTILSPPSLAAQLRPLLAQNMQVISRPTMPPTAGERLKQSLGPLRRILGRLMRRLIGLSDQGLPSEVPELDSFIRSIRADVIHFMVPYYSTGSDVPTVFTIHDLQHEHLPWIFGDAMIRYRRMLNNAVAKECQAVVAISRFTADDFQKHHPCSPEKLTVIPWAAYVSPDENAGALTDDDHRKLAKLPTQFIFYPAYSYRHKNHAALLEALSLLKNRDGLRIPLVCTGGRSDDWRLVTAAHQRLSPIPEVHDLGYVSRSLLRVLYQKACFVVFPSLFEGAGLPLLEAASLRVPIACSEIPPFREFGGDGPAFFDPTSTFSMAEVLGRFWQDESARQTSALLTAKHTASLSWQSCAYGYLEIYRRTVARL